MRPRVECPIDAWRRAIESIDEQWPWATGKASWPGAAVGHVLKRRRRRRRREGCADCVSNRE